MPMFDKIPDYLAPGVQVAKVPDHLKWLVDNMVGEDKLDDILTLLGKGVELGFVTSTKRIDEGIAYYCRYYYAGGSMRTVGVSEITDGKNLYIYQHRPYSSIYYDWIKYVETSTNIPAPAWLFVESKK